MRHANVFLMSTPRKILRRHDVTCLCKVCGRDTKRHYEATPRSFGTAESHIRWWLRIKKYPVRGLFQQCPVVT